MTRRGSYQFVTDSAETAHGTGRKMEIIMIDDTDDDAAFVEDAITDEEAKESQTDLMEAMNG